MERILKFKIIGVSRNYRLKIFALHPHPEDLKFAILAKSYLPKTA